MSTPSTPTPRAGTADRAAPHAAGRTTGHAAPHASATPRPGTADRTAHHASATGRFSATAARLTAARRAADLAALRDASDAGRPAHYDVVVVGAGVTGCGVALDAVTRGLTVLLVDAHDLAFGTSRWSSKLAHGGLRYLATGDVSVATRSARERGILMERTAPHLTRALPQVVPVQDRYSVLNRVLPRVGFLAGDLLRVAARTSSRTLPRSRTVTAATVRALCPAVETSDLRLGYVNYDGQLVDDARLVTCLARTAAGYGATVITHCRAASVSGREVVLEDTLAEGDDAAAAPTAATPTTVTAGAVVNATGVWAGDMDPAVTVRPSRGTHLVVDAGSVGNPTGALTVPVPGATNRFCFILPEQLGRCYIGLTDEDQPGAIPDEPEVPDSDVTWILDVVNQALATRLTSDDVIGAYAGLRPLITLDGAGAGASTADLSREHVILTGDDGLVTVTGGKLTEYRLMAEQTVDAVLAQGAWGGAGGGAGGGGGGAGGGVGVGAVGRGGHGGGGRPGPCVTTSIPLVGAPRSAVCRAVTESDLAGLPASLVERFGWEAPEVVRACVLDRPLDPVAPGLDVTRAEFSFHVTHEGAVTVSDILDRRSRVGLVPADREAALPAAREALAAAADQG
ncbi:glycerol-3-phosphate dehydrogenase/oxidase [Corynebacterium bovis]|uniref:Glycerol-3-phosphate dehydrogenase/oxidase n=7 Tax=Corynebacterium bovis TaxID=36808 RepID=A0A3R8VVV5_9CORY|nr:glycerol-3-phosphate dehydrogenase/oxidase [Corynebacterium bovis]RRO98965.1 glycerol-3-phosphate dehydrogenase/oxidase [Corynebacterium bovis]RRQ01780.1 glycerol-3-phosphate dehydrogenase/oxidase [Corynebacterium bovis]RRQ05924.1 glycerol-3-phosphate dehydrogenase/oxidase [Corynebacterium bovis]RRQ08654.1 glycerol-3-phosphate dehydrogenase/oxidase [Corynebacterium bovis]